MRMPLATRLKYTAGRYFPFLKIAPPISKQKIFTLRPVRHSAIEWDTTDDDEALLKIPHRKDRMAKAMTFWFHIPQTRAVQLDEVGTSVWKMCDGEHSVETIVKEISRKYKMNRREVEMSVASYLQMLAERHFIGFYERGGKTTP